MGFTQVSCHTTTCCNLSLTPQRTLERTRQKKKCTIKQVFNMIMRVHGSLYQVLHASAPGCALSAAPSSPLWGTDASPSVDFATPFAEDLDTMCGGEAPSCDTSGELWTDFSSLEALDRGTISSEFWHDLFPFAESLKSGLSSPFSPAANVSESSPSFVKGLWGFGAPLFANGHFMLGAASGCDCVPV